MSSSARLQAATSRLDALQAESRTSQLFLSLLPPDHRDQGLQTVRSLESDISSHRTAVARAQDSLSAAEQLLPSLTYPSPPSLPAPTSQPPPSTQHLRTRALEDLVADTRALIVASVHELTLDLACGMMPPQFRLNW
jgi:hypothetical protein